MGQPVYPDSNRLHTVFRVHNQPSVSGFRGLREPQETPLFYSLLQAYLNVSTSQRLTQSLQSTGPNPVLHHPVSPVL